MELKDIFEQATRQKLRFTTPRGPITVEDLWDLPLAEGHINLNALAVGINRSLKESASEESFVPSAARKIDADVARLELQLAILKKVIEVKDGERVARQKATAKRARLNELYEALADSEKAALKGKTPEEIRAMIDAEMAE